MKYMTSLLIVAILSIGLVAPQKTEAVIYFGGPIGLIIPCVNTVIYANLGAPRGGEYLWSPSVTRTYSFGPPSHSGQYLLGSAGPSYFCLVSVLPIIVRPGLLMLMMGSSQ